MTEIRQRSLEEIRLEIVLLASGVLVLVSLLGILIFISIGLTPPTRRYDNEKSFNSTAWGGGWDEEEDEALDEAYYDETFIDCVRRRSLS